MSRKKDDEFWSYGPDGARKMSYSQMERDKKKLTFWQKVFWIVGIILAISYFAIIWIVKN